MIEQFTTGPDDIVNRLNQIVDEINDLRNISGDDFISVSQAASGKTVSLNTNKVRELFPTSGRVRRARTTAAAGATATITANLYNAAGVEQTAGDEAGVTVYCAVSNGHLNTAIPRLGDNDDIFVVKLPYDDAGTVEQRWYCTQLFQKINTNMFAVSSDNLVHIVDSDMFTYANGKLESKLDECE